jgi:hypothetical protein
MAWAQIVLNDVPRRICGLVIMLVRGFRHARGLWSLRDSGVRENHEGLTSNGSIGCALSKTPRIGAARALIPELSMRGSLGKT